MHIYKILRSAEWQALQDAGQTAGAPVDVADGYVHFSTTDQVQATCDKHFAGETGLWLLAYEAAALSPLRWEEARGGKLFPHLYGPLPLAAVIWARPVASDGAGHRLPDLT